jgi:5-methylcytosine-specific restriction endonuclease McrA
MTKEERAAWHKDYRLANKERLLAYDKAYRLANNEKRSEQLKIWRKENPEKCSKHKKAYLLKLNLMNKNISGRTLAAWSFQVRERDTACLYCGSTDKLHAHHILSKVKHPEWALFLNNGITLCEVCHIQEHTINGEI